VRIRDFSHGDRVRDRTEGVEALGGCPWQALALRFVLDVARREVDGREVVRYHTRQAILGKGGREVAVRAVGPDDDAELDFMVEGCAVGSDDGAGVGGKNGGWGFEEEEWLRGAGGGEFGDVVAGREIVSRCRSSLLGWVGVGVLYA
jgi:hypothetical protein